MEVSPCQIDGDLQSAERLVRIKSLSAALFGLVLSELLPEPAEELLKSYPLSRAERGFLSCTSTQKAGALSPQRGWLLLRFPTALPGCFSLSVSGLENTNYKLHICEVRPDVSMSVSHLQFTLN